MKIKIGEVKNVIPNPFEDIYHKLDSKINNLISVRSKIIDLKREHIVLDREENDEALSFVINDFHNTFYESISDICSRIYEEHMFELANQSNFDIITLQTKSEIQKLVNTYMGYINPTHVYDYLFANNSLENRQGIVEGYNNGYIKLNDVYEVEINTHYIERFVLELLGYSKLKVMYNCNYQQCQ